MDALNAFQQGLGSVHRAREARLQQTGRIRESSHDSEEGGTPKIAHTLTACCRCRQRKTRCDPTLPRCIPCERVGALCEYFDATKQKRIPRTYVIHLQDRVRELEAELSQYTEDDDTLQDTEDIVRPGGLVRLDENETPRFLGPSSGIAMARLVMEEAKRFTDSRSIRELVPEVSERKTPAQSPSDPVDRKKSYPMVSAVAAEKLPSRLVAEKLLEVFNQRSQLLTPTLHEPTLARHLDDVYAGSTDPYENFVIRMVLAISMQKLDSQYAGLADSYYLAAMQHLEDVVRPKDIKTLQCLVLVANYSLLTPTRTAIYYVLGLATRICEQLGLTEEKNIVQGLSGNLNPLELDMRRRLSWIILSMEYGLAHSLGRPNAFATGQDHVDVEFFATVDDENITANGILPGPESPKKLIAIHFMKMRLVQAEIRRVLYQHRRAEPNNDEHPWFAAMQQKIEDWRNSSPLNLQAWFRGRSQTMVVFLYRPSPQVPRPSLRAATLCFDASAENIRYQSSAMRSNTIEITWIFVQTIFMALNTLLWTASYSGVRSLHAKEEFEELVELALEMMVKCGERWPGSEEVSKHYAVLAKACLRSYDVSHPGSMSDRSTPSVMDANTPNSEHSNVTTGSVAPSDSSSVFGYVFNPMVEPIPPDYRQNQQQQQQQQPPAFRSNSIFVSPSSIPPADRRYSYFAPEGVQQQQQQFSMPPPLPPVTMGPWGTTQAPVLNPQLIATTIQQSMQPLPAFSADPVFTQQPALSFNPQLFQMQPPSELHPRLGSLSMQQQIELMESLEAEGVTGIGNYFSMPPIPFDAFYNG